MAEPVDDEPWYSVRCLILSRSESGERVYEERVTLWRADDFTAAIARAEREARDYASDLDAEYVGLAQAFHLLGGDAVGDGAEVFSLMRTSDLDPDEYIGRFFDTGAERQRISE